MDGLGQTIDWKQTMKNTLQIALQYKLTLDKGYFAPWILGFSSTLQSETSTT